MTPLELLGLVAVIGVSAYVASLAIVKALEWLFDIEDDV